MSRSDAFCVAASAASPPLVERIGLDDGKKEIVFDPNAELRSRYRPSVRFLRWDIGGATIGSSRRRSYFPTARGLKSIEYLLCLARAHLILRSRAVEVTFECSFERAIDLSCRKNARVFDGRLAASKAGGEL